jgi:hypothetical protein
MGQKVKRQLFVKYLKLKRKFSNFGASGETAPQSRFGHPKPG